jgi:hypothetical protein
LEGAPAVVAVVVGVGVLRAVGWAVVTGEVNAAGSPGSPVASRELPDIFFFLFPNTTLGV